MNTSLNFEVRRDHLPTWRWLEGPAALPLELKEGEVLLEVEKFAFTSNNVTYAAYGDRLSYWNFFPSSEGWGRVPVWGYVRVLQSRHPDIASGERYYGYVPMASQLVVEAGRVGPRGFIDQAAHRQPMPAVYNRYSRASAEANADSEALEMILRPLFLTSFLLAEFLRRENLFGARRIVFSSASSKTAYGTAFMLAGAAGDVAQNVEIVGLTSPRNLEFVQDLGCYARVLSYDQLDSLPADEPTLYVDFAGGRELLSRVHHHFTQLVHSCTAGGTQWNALDQGAPLPGPKPKLFFAALDMALGDSGPGPGLQQRMSEGWHRFCARVLDADRPWMRISSLHGKQAVEQVYTQMLQGSVAADRGYVLTLR